MAQVPWSPQRLGGLGGQGWTTEHPFLFADSSGEKAGQSLLRGKGLKPLEQCDLRAE